MVSNNYHWGSERGQPKKKERHEIDAFTMLVSKVHVLFLKVNRLQPTPIQNGAASGLYGQVSICEMCGVQGHNMSKCHLGQLPQEPPMLEIFIVLNEKDKEEYQGECQ